MLVDNYLKQQMLKFIKTFSDPTRTLTFIVKKGGWKSRPTAEADKDEQTEEGLFKKQFKNLV